MTPANGAFKLAFARFKRARFERQLGCGVRVLPLQARALEGELRRSWSPASAFSRASREASRSLSESSAGMPELRAAEIALLRASSRSTCLAALGRRQLRLGSAHGESLRSRVRRRAPPPGATSASDAAIARAARESMRASHWAPGRRRRLPRRALRPPGRLRARVSSVLGLDARSLSRGCAALSRATAGSTRTRAGSRFFIVAACGTTGARGTGGRRTARGESA